MLRLILHLLHPVATPTVISTFGHSNIQMFLRKHCRMSSCGPMSWGLCDPGQKHLVAWQMKLLNLSLDLEDGADTRRAGSSSSV